MRIVCDFAGSWDIRHVISVMMIFQGFCGIFSLMVKIWYQGRRSIQMFKLFKKQKTEIVSPAAGVLKINN